MSCHRPSHLSALLVAVALTVTLVGVPGTPAHARPASLTASITASITAPPTVAAAKPQRPATDPPLVAASKALQGASPAADRPEATLALRDLFLARPTLEGIGAQFAGGMLARPTAGASDPFSDGYTRRATKRCTTHFCLHWVRAGRDAPTARAWTATTLRVLERVWRHHVDRLGYRAPAPDGKRGGNAKFDVYLKDVGSRGLYGYCAPERRVPGQPKQASGFCVLDNDFSRDQFGRAPKQSLRVTAAHEFFHAIQFAYDFTEDPWLLESTATWMEDQFADGVDDNLAYVGFGQNARPRVPLDLFETSGYAHYGNWTFWEFLAERFGVDVVRDVIERTGTGRLAGTRRTLPDDFSAQALRRTLRSRGGLPTSYAAYAAYNTIPAATYPEGAAYPAAPVTERTLSRRSPRTTVRARLDHLTSRSVRITPAPGVRRGSQVVIRVDGPRRRFAPAAHAIVVRAIGTLQQRRVVLDRRGRGEIVVRFDAGIRSVTVALANASTRYRCDRGSTLSCKGQARDGAERLVLTATLRTPRTR